ncbi:hypothetical protein FHU28_003121 [Micromonospora echinospora]|uniref:Thioesterase domain-containing protein n=1 Tax=Micromonospora echinospora TaxID=1877 RepID=A0ABR6MD25_MICEC|nr:hypothetical protein [Micromonospora echinospora]MBB5113282.1 hypothetical protein [Micromonospora echinospora]
MLAHEIAVQLQAVGETVGALIILDQYPKDPGIRTVIGDEPAPDEEAQLAALTEVVRKEAGAVPGNAPDEELRRFAVLRRNNFTCINAHEYGRFDGDALLVVADRSIPERAPTAELCKPYITGEISEVRLPCGHEDLNTPAMLGQMWAVAASWLGRNGDAPSSWPAARGPPRHAHGGPARRLIGRSAAGVAPSPGRCLLLVSDLLQVANLLVVAQTATTAGARAPGPGHQPSSTR